MRRFSLILLALVIIAAFTACTYQITIPEMPTKQTPSAETVSNQQITINFSFGQRTGTYTGVLSNGLPNGYGSFYYINSEGSGWLYEGNWVNGRMNGQGKTTWSSGFAEEGLYQNDNLNGYGKEYWKNALQYEGYYTNGIPNGQGSIYNYHGDLIFTGNFKDGFIQETAEQRYARIAAFKYECAALSYNDIYNYAQYESSARVAVSGTVFDVYEYSEDGKYFCDFLMYEQGVHDSSRIICVYHWLCEGEPAVYEDQYVSVWGTTEYLYSYTSENNEYLTVPLINARCIE